MKKLIIAAMAAFSLTLACAVFVPLKAVQAAGAPEVGAPFPSVAIPAPESPEHRNYLGLTRGDSFRLSQVKADIIIVEVLSMYCPYCQAEAPRVNELYGLIEDNPKLKGKIKIVGMAAGNTALERDIFRDKFEVPFPIVHDGDFVLHKALGEVRTPYFIGVRNSDGQARVFFSRLGAFDDPADFLDMVLEKAGGL